VIAVFQLVLSKKARYVDCAVDKYADFVIIYNDDSICGAIYP
jgi:hypothetical protein